MSTNSKSSRRTQAERVAETRAKLIEAAIVCLHRAGYSATTFGTVAQEAGVSRGSITYNFASKTDLMLAVVRAVFEDDAKLYNQSIEAMSPAAWMRELPTTMWDVISRPSAIAVMEITLASRSDPELAEKLREMQQRLVMYRNIWIAERHRDAGLVEDGDSPAIHRVFLAAVRGLALDAVFLHNAEEIEQSIGVLRRMLCLLYPALDEAMPERRAG